MRSASLASRTCRSLRCAARRTAASETAQVNDTGRSDQSGWTTYRRLLTYSARYWPLAIIAAIGMIFDAACGSAFTLIIKPMLDELFVRRDPDTIKWMPVIIIALFFVRGVATFTADFSMAR